MAVEFTPIGFVTETSGAAPDNDRFFDRRERIQILPEYREGLTGLEAGGKIQLIFFFHLSEGYELITFAHGWGKETGVFNSHSPRRPNRIGVSEVTIVSVSVDDGELVIDGGDLWPDTPVLDIKPVM